MKVSAVAALIGALSGLIVSGATGASLTTAVDGIRIELNTNPEPPVKDRKIAPITDARVTLTGRMADGMSTAAPLRAVGEPGLYRGEVLFTMAGRWDLTVRVVRQAGRIEIPVREDVGR